jgi:hypothetical protein
MIHKKKNMPKEENRGGRKGEDVVERQHAPSRHGPDCYIP